MLRTIFKKTDKGLLSKTEVDILIQSLGDTPISANILKEMNSVVSKLEKKRPVVVSSKVASHRGDNFIADTKTKIAYALYSQIVSLDDKKEIDYIYQNLLTKDKQMHDMLKSMEPWRQYSAYANEMPTDQGYNDFVKGVAQESNSVPAGEFHNEYFGYTPPPLDDKFVEVTVVETESQSEPQLLGQDDPEEKAEEPLQQVLQSKQQVVQTVVPEQQQVEQQQQQQIDKLNAPEAQEQAKQTQQEDILLNKIPSVHSSMPDLDSGITKPTLQRNISATSIISNLEELRGSLKGALSDENIEKLLKVVSDLYPSVITQTQDVPTQTNIMIDMISSQIPLQGQVAVDTRNILQNLLNRVRTETVDLGVDTDTMTTMEEDIIIPDGGEVPPVPPTETGTAGGEIPLSIVQQDTTKNIEAMGPLSSSAVYHKDSVKIYFGSDTAPQWDTNLKSVIETTDFTMQRIIDIMEGVIKEIGGHIYVFKRMSSSKQELMEILQLQHSYIRLLGRGNRGQIVGMTSVQTMSPSQPAQPVASSTTTGTDYSITRAQPVGGNISVVPNKGYVQKWLNRVELGTKKGVNEGTQQLVKQMNIKGLGSGYATLGPHSQDDFAGKRNEGGFLMSSVRDVKFKLNEKC